MKGALRVLPYDHSNKNQKWRKRVSREEIVQSQGILDC